MVEAKSSESFAMVVVVWLCFALLCFRLGLPRSPTLALNLLFIYLSLASAFRRGVHQQAWLSLKLGAENGSFTPQSCSMTFLSLSSFPAPGGGIL